VRGVGGVSAGNGTLDLTHARQALYHLKDIPASDRPN
jgi:hypothetical protein